MKDNFIYYAVAFVILLLVLTTCNQAKADPLLTDMVGPSVQLGNYCSGQIIHSKRNEKTGKVSTVVLTAKHCVKDGELVSINKAVYNEQNRKIAVKSYLATLLGKSFKSDLALLKLRDEETFFDDVAKVAPAKTPLRFGQDVYVVAYPLGLSMTLTAGKLGYVEDGLFDNLSNSKQFYRATPDVMPGSSGSAMFTLVDNSYQIIGITTGMVGGITFMNFFTPVEEINEYLDTAKIAIEGVE